MAEQDDVKDKDETAAPEVEAALDGGESHDVEAGLEADADGGSEAPPLHAESVDAEVVESVDAELEESGEASDENEGLDASESDAAEAGLEADADGGSEAPPLHDDLESDAAPLEADDAGVREDMPAAATPVETMDLETLMAPDEVAPQQIARGSAELRAIVEALIFASPEPLTPRAMYKLLDQETREDIDAALAGLRHDYERPGGLHLVEVAGGYQIATRPDLHEWVRRLFHERTSSKLTVAALETLAVIAYRQPVTAAEITEIRGVNTSGVLNTLLERHLIKIVGRKAVVGRPFLYSTTKEFLIRFGLNDLGDLPKVEDMNETLGLDIPLLAEKTVEEEMLPLDEPAGDDKLTPEDLEGAPDPLG